MMERRSLLLAGAVVIACAVGAAPASAFTARGSVEQVYVLDAGPGTKVTLLDRRDRKLDSATADAQGAALFRKVKPGRGYRVRLGGRKGPTSGALRVLTTRPAPPNTDIYDQSMPSSGYGYLTTRDGTQLAYTVHPPDDIANALPGGMDPPSTPGGPTPTLIEYSGYGTADPAGPESGISIIANLMGFTVVDVNMRGTGCSGGAFDFFEPLQGLDGYDVIETVARQPWVEGGRVGMFGISYGGISQLFTAQYNPPSLAAITPLSVLDQTQTTLYPGGVLNTGFAVEWAKDRVEDSKPSGPDDGQPWAYERIQAGDEQCAANQALHGQAKDLLAKIEANDTYRPKVADPLSPLTFVDRIKAPVFMACQWQDEQTGGHCPTLASRFERSDRKWFTFTNGTHVDSLDPETINRLYDFLQLYVAKRAPGASVPLLRLAAPVLYQEAMGVSGVTLPPDPIQQEPTYEGALAAFEALPPVRVLFDNGAGGQPGQPYPGFERSFPKLPVPGARARSWYFADDAALADRPPKREGRASFRWDSGARPPTNFTGDTAAGEDGLWTATPPYDWRQPPPGSAASWLTGPLGADTTVVGGGAVRVWVRSSTRKLDLQATISEVRPDGKETFVQGGWVRGTLRALDRRKSTRLEPVLSLRARDREPMPRGRFAEVTIPLYYQGHAYRAGSRIRVSITAPDGDQPVWAFAEPQPKGTSNVKIAYSKRRPSRLLLPVLKDGEIPTELPPCPALRGQPCRDYAP
jgi:predicted acyl esterase